MFGRNPDICAKCKGVKRLCGRPRCPILERLEALQNISKIASSRSFFGSTPPSILVGEANYPLVRVGANVPPEVGVKARLYDAPEEWWGRKGIEDIIKLRASMVYSSSRLNVRVAPRSGRDKVLENLRIAALSELPVDTEVLFRKPPRVSIRFDSVLSPVGPSGEVERLEVVSNPVVPRRVDNIISDFDVDFRTAVEELYFHGVSYYHIVRLLSLGVLGARTRRRIVPTRWAITATDKMLGDRLLERIRNYREISEYEVYTSEYVGNRYFLLFVPGAWSFEMIEVWLPRSVWVKSARPVVIENYELNDGRARKPGVDGGYYAIRFPVLEFLQRRCRQAAVVAVRVITPDYYAPIGSWQIRESIRNAFKEKPVKFDELRKAWEHIAAKLDRLREDVEKEARLLRFFFLQRSLRRFL